MLDTLIRGGTVIDGTGAEPTRADIGIRDGRIVAVGAVDEPAGQTIDATGLHVLPGFIDIHTHYDGQASWDETFTPSIYHGVTTVVMGNCGVGFAPVRPGDRDVLIDLMEGVEEIPGSALTEGMRWNWESFTDYGRALDAIPHSLDFMTLVPHDCLRLYVMGERAACGEPATANDIAAMQNLLRQALHDGAAGLAMGSTETHRTAQGRMTPSFEVNPAELNALAEVLKDLPYRVIQGISDFASPRGTPDEEKARFDREYAKLEDMARIAGRPLSVTWMDRVIAPRQAGWLGAASLASAAKGITIRLQASPRGIGVLNGLDTTLNLLAAFPGYRALAHLPAAERARALREPAVRERILAETPVSLSVPGSSVPPLADYVVAHFEQIAFTLFPLLPGEGGGMDYEPLPALSFGAQAKARGVPARELMLAHWGLQRTRGPKLPLPLVVQMLTQRNALHMGLNDRGVIAVGMKADINLVDFERLALPMPEIVRDLPQGGRRVVQRANGYVATLVSGEVVIARGHITDARPGRWVHGPSH